MLNSKIQKQLKNHSFRYVTKHFYVIKDYVLHVHRSLDTIEQWFKTYFSIVWPVTLSTSNHSKMLSESTLLFLNKESRRQKRKVSNSLSKEERLLVWEKSVKMLFLNRLKIWSHLTDPQKIWCFRLLPVKVTKNALKLKFSSHGSNSSGKHTEIHSTFSETTNWSSDYTK